MPADLDSQFAKLVSEGQFERQTLGALAGFAQPFVQFFEGQIPAKDDLQLLSKTYGPDFAGIVLYRCLVESALHGGFLKSLTQTRDGKVLDPRAPLDFTHNLEIVCVQSHFSQGLMTQHELSAAWSGKWQVVRELARLKGYRTDLIELPASQSIAKNAHELSRFLKNKAQEAKRDGTRLVIVTQGRGALEWRAVVQNMPAGDLSLKAIKAWINISGSLQGSPVFTNMRLNGNKSSPKFFAKLSSLLKRSPSASESLLFEAASDYAWWKSEFKLPSSIFTVNILGIPTHQHLSLKMRENQIALREQGPSDGLQLLADCRTDFGFTVPVMGGTYAFEIESLFAVPILKTLTGIAIALKNQNHLRPNADLEFAGLADEVRSKQSPKLELMPSIDPRLASEIRAHSDAFAADQRSARLDPWRTELR